MSLFCLLRQRALARHAALSLPLDSRSALAKHVARCATCRAYESDLRRLTADLPNALPRPTPSADFSEQTWQRWQARERARRSSFPALHLLGAAGGAACLGMFWWNRPPSPAAVPTVVSRSQLPRIQSAALPATLPAQLVQARTSVRKPAPKRAVPKRRVREPDRRLYLHVRRQRTLQLARQPAPPQRAAPGAAVPPRINWAAWGAWYDAQGAYHEAAAAYGRAYAEQPTPLLALAAGQAAENAGDMTLALTYYTKSLQRPAEMHSAPEKGCLPCSDQLVCML
jgi:hypothetical protein